MMYNIKLSLQEIDDLTTCIATRMVKLDDYINISRNEDEIKKYIIEKERICGLFSKFLVKD